MAIVVLTTCCGRRDHALVSTRAWARDAQVTRVVVVDYGCPEDTGGALERIWATERPDASLTIVRAERRRHFHKMAAWNAGLREIIGGAERTVLLVDIDDVPTVQLPVPFPGGLVVSADAYGFLGVSREDLEALGLFEERFAGYGADDLWVRLWLYFAVGVRPLRELPAGCLRSLEHSEQAKTRYYEEQNPLRNNARNVLVLAELFRERFGVDFSDDEALLERFGASDYAALRRLCNEAPQFGWRSELPLWRSMLRC